MRFQNKMDKKSQPCGVFSSPSPLLSVFDVSAQRGGWFLFQNLNFKLFPSQTIVLRGANGCGKTTLLKILAGISKQASGRVTWQSPSCLYIGHESVLFAQQTVQVAVEDFSVFLKAPPGLLQEVIKALSLESLLSLPTDKLSAGQKRWISLSRLLMARRLVWILDEPTTHLDEKAQQIFWKHAQHHLTAGGSIVMASHCAVSLRQQREIWLSDASTIG